MGRAWAAAGASTVCARAELGQCEVHENSVVQVRRRASGREGTRVGVVGFMLSRGGNELNSVVVVVIVNRPTFPGLHSTRRQSNPHRSEEATCGAGEHLL